MRSQVVSLLKELLEKVRQLSPEELQVAAMKKKAQAAMKRKESAAMKKKQKAASQQDKNKEADNSKRKRSCHSEPQGSPPKTKKSDPKRAPIWGRRMSLWDLEYWPTLKLRHNLDVMHIEKNICDNLLGTILKMDSKNKDNLNARLDIAKNKLNVLKHLQLKKKDSEDYYEWPEAPYALS
jgi:hypothetical protein